jgi:hypothetical protein
MAQENDKKAELAAIAAAGLTAAGGAAALKQGVRANALLDTELNTARGAYGKAFTERERLTKLITGGRPNAAIPATHKLYPQWKAALDAQNAAKAIITKNSGTARGILGKIGATSLLGKNLTGALGKASGVLAKTGKWGKVGAGVLSAGAAYGANKAINDDDDEMRQKVYNKLRYGHYETNSELGKRKTLTETGNIGEGGLSEEEFDKYYKDNKDAFGRQYGGLGNVVHLGSQIGASLYNPIAGFLGGLNQDRMVNSAEDKFNMSMADSLASQAQGRRVINNANNLYGDEFATGLLGGYKPLENMMGVDGEGPRQVIKPYVDPATAAAQQKAKIAYDADSDRDMWGTAFRPNAARDGGRRWFQDVNELVSSGRDNPEDNELRRDALRGIMHSQGLISDEAFYGDLPKGAINPAGANPAGAITPQATVPAGVVQNAQSNLSNVGRPMSQNINIPPPTNPQDAESLMRTRSIMSGETNVAGAVGQSQAAYMNNRGMLTSNQQNNAVSDWRKSYWEGRGVRGFDYTPPPKPAQPAQSAAPIVGPSTLPSNQMVNSTPIGPFGGSRNRFNDTSGYDFDMSGVERHDMPAGSPVPLSPMRPTPDRRPPSPFNFAEPVPPPSPMRPNPTQSPYGRFRAGSTPY